MKVLILVHVEETFRKYFGDNLLPEIEKAIHRNHFDRIIHCTSNLNDDQPVYEIANLVDTQIDWAWGYEPDVFPKQEQQFVIESKGHEYTWIPPFLRDAQYWLKSAKVTLGGGCEAECLADMESVLDYLNIPFQKQRKFVY